MSEEKGEYEISYEISADLIDESRLEITHKSISPEGASDIIMYKMIELEEEAIRKTLIHLGWTPPKETENKD